MKKYIIIATSLIVCSVIIGGSIISVQSNKQNSIERQQRISLEAKRVEMVAKEIKDEQDDIFNKSLECEKLLAGLKKRWNNVIGIRYSSFENSCMVKFTKDGKNDEGRIGDMIDSD